MYAGKIVEEGAHGVLFSSVRMPYTEALLKSIPRLENKPHTKLEVIAGRPPDLVNPPKGLQLQPPLSLRPTPLLRGRAAAAGR